MTTLRITNENFSNGRTLPSQDVQSKLEQRLAASRLEHERRAATRFNAMKSGLFPIWTGCCWSPNLRGAAIVSWDEHHQARRLVAARFLPRARRWFVDEAVAHS